MRYTYATYRTREKAEAALDAMFADGEVSWGERPQIERLPLKGGRYAITLAG